MSTAGLRESMRPLTAWLLWGAAGVLGVLVVIYCMQSRTTVSQQQPLALREAVNASTQRYFNRVYNERIWGDYAGGSGWGSEVAFTTGIRSILRAVVHKYNIESIVDMPCGAMEWMPHVLELLNEDQPGFRYLGLDIADVAVEKVKHLTRYPECPEDPTWEFGVLDMTTEPIPDGYDLIFSRDALQHLSMQLVVDALENISKAKAKYFLVGSYKESTGNFNLKMVHGEDFKIDLRMPPFELEDYLHYYDEHTTDGKGVLLYDIKKLRKTNWKAMRTRVAKLQDLPSQRRLLKTIEHTRGT